MRNSPYIYPFLVFCIVLAFSAAGLGSEFHYFDSGVDYWGTEKKKSISGPSEKSPKNVTKEKKTSDFPWHKYMSPKHKEFFKEGKHLPPEPFMEVFGNPTDENIELWFKYHEIKNKHMTAFLEKLKEYRFKKGIRDPLSVALPTPKPIPKDTKRFRFRMYFSSQCPYCKRMYKTLAQLRSQGYYIEAVQVDKGEIRGVPFSVRMATEGEIKEKKVTNVPLLLIGDLKKKVVYRLTGYRSLQEVYQTMNSF